MITLYCNFSFLYYKYNIAIVISLGKTALAKYTCINETQEVVMTFLNFTLNFYKANSLIRDITAP